jgi:hypothetical protein
LLFLLLTVVGITRAQDRKEEFFYESGNAFLRNCDSGSSFMLGQSARVRETYSLMCTIWVLGIAHGIQVEDNFRPERVLTPTEGEHNKLFEKFLEGEGITPALTVPSGNLCLPPQTTNEQYKLVVIAYMKAHPTQLELHAAYLTAAALKSAWACKAAQ